MIFFGKIHISLKISVDQKQANHHLLYKMHFQIKDGMHALDLFSIFLKEEKSGRHPYFLCQIDPRWLCNILILWTHIIGLNIFNLIYVGRFNLEQIFI